MSNERADDADVDLDRRRTLKLLGGGLTATAAGVAVDNVLLGYELLGTNLKKQDLTALVEPAFFRGVRRTDVRDNRVLLWDETVRIQRGQQVLASRDLPEVSAAAATGIDAEYGLDGYVESGVPVLASLYGDVRFEFSNYGSFFDRVRAGDPVSEAVELLRSGVAVSPDTVEGFAGADPADPEAVVEGLVDGFREHTHYDLDRYAAGSVQDNVIFGAAALRPSFRGDVAFESVAASEGTGLFCNEFANRSVEALHAVPAREQTAPVFGGTVHDRRHKHVYTAIGSVLREDDGYVVPMTFVDYTHATLYDDLGLTGLLGEGLEAYNRRHMATGISFS
ncbi:hypothetical protein [Halorarius halobius]|uniref:hypothetical protein n=1 Tax=Halorarius halobius TaxID=2962671 RepID=UPI0020CF22BF|nr:hypothetical protein [Halorarius halobius]